MRRVSKSLRRAIAVGLLVIQSGLAQDVKHAPTIQQCAADLNLWTSEIRGWPNETPDQLREATKRLTVHEMQGRILSLGDCWDAYPVLRKSKAEEMSASLTLLGFYSQEIESRLFSFLDRHGMLNKFTDEDESGKR